MRRFLVDEIWDRYHDMPQLHREELREHLGELFDSAFMNKDTRSYESIPNETLAVWLKVMGGDPPGLVHFTENITPLEFAPRDIAIRYQGFSQTRQQRFDYGNTTWPLQQQYFRLQEGAARREFLRQNPILKVYWTWRRDFMLRNPDVVPYIEDDPEKWPKYTSVQELEQAYAAQPSLTRFECR